MEGIHKRIMSQGQPWAKTARPYPKIAKSIKGQGA
jgi:hypothetical protein